MADAQPRFITAEGLRRLRQEYEELFGIERPRLVETVSWAAALGDRSENADYIYGKRRLREIDRRLAHLARIMKAAKVVDPAAQKSRGEVRFGATIELADADDNRRTLTIVGDDESDAAAGASAGALRWRARSSAPKSATSALSACRRARRATRSSPSAIRTSGRAQCPLSTRCGH
jgi:transcription elongation factor GreB